MISSTAVLAGDLPWEPPTRNGVHREVARQPCRPQMALQSGRHTVGGERQATPPPFGRNHGEHVPGGYVPPHPLRAEMYAVTSRNAQTTGQSRSASITTATLEALSVLPN